MWVAFFKFNQNTMNITSPDISVLDFKVTYNLSSITPQILVENISSGPDLASCKWWIEIKTPSGTFIHKGNASTPDLNGVWGSYTIPDIWPQPFGQIEWSSNPYSATLFVKDGPGTIFSFAKETLIIRPNGSSPKSNDNFGSGKLYATMRCNEGNLYVEDQTNFAWNGILGQVTNQRMILIYPMDPTGVIPSPVEVNKNTNVLFPVTYSASCYTISLSKTVRYESPNGTAVIIKYKFKKEFAVACDIDLCPLIDAHTKAISDKDSCLSSATITEINSLLLSAIVGILQPLCGIDVGSIVDKIKKLGGYNCNCSVTSGINGSTPGNRFTLDIDSNCGDIHIDEAVVIGNIVKIRLSDKSYQFIIDPSSDLMDAFSVTTAVGDSECDLIYRLRVDRSELALGLQELLLNYAVDVDGASDFPAAFEFVPELDLITNTMYFHFKMKADELISDDPLNFLEVKPDGIFANAAKLLTIINDNTQLKNYFCDICSGSGVACPVVTGLTTTVGTYDAGTNTYPVTLNWTPGAGVVDYTVVLGSQTATVSITSHSFNVAPGATYAYSVTANCTSGSAAPTGGNVVVPVAPAVCPQVTGVSVAVGAYNSGSGTYPVTVSWSAAAGAVSYTVVTPTGSVTTGGTNVVFNLAPSTSYTSGTITTNCSSTTSAPLPYNVSTPAAPTLAPAPTVMSMTTNAFGGSKSVSMFLRMDPSANVTGVIVEVGTLAGGYTYTSVTIAPGTNTHPNAVAPTPGGFGSNDITFQYGSIGSSNYYKIKITMINAAGSSVVEYYEYYLTPTYVSPRPAFVRVTNPTLPYVTVSGLGAGTVTFTLNTNGNTNINVATGTDIWHLNQDAIGGYDNSVNGQIVVPITGLSSGVQVFQFEVTQNSGTSGVAMIPAVVIIP